mmetsp:Transcript_51863/g.150942  ORF Transcript_51863/g.150942 Transcript_51863/m.150942 type:complete len:201 (+) Transcript_51863:927-1529(+)
MDPSARARGETGRRLRLGLQALRPRGQGPAPSRRERGRWGFGRSRRADAAHAAHARRQHEAHLCARFGEANAVAQRQARKWRRLALRGLPRRGRGARAPRLPARRRGGDLRTAEDRQDVPSRHGAGQRPEGLRRPRLVALGLRRGGRRQRPCARVLGLRGLRQRRLRPLTRRAVAGHVGALVLGDARELRGRRPRRRPPR